MTSYEVNFDGLVGPVHNYGGLSFGNVASRTNVRDVSNPRRAAKQGLKKMKYLADLGFKQGVIPPQLRPDLALLRDIGFSGTDAQVLTKAAKKAPELLASVYSAASMWTANAATVSPSPDTQDSRVHFTPANLNAKMHRAFEHQTTAKILKGIFSDERYFVHHRALPSISQLGDEGAANHTRFCAGHGSSGVEFFVYGRQAFNENGIHPKRFPARQTLEASQAIARLHGLDESAVVFAQQNPEVIDEGVFHNDVIAVGNENVLFYHERAFNDSDKVLEEIDRKLVGADLNAFCVRNEEISVEDCVRSYLFNSQLLSVDDGSMILLVPEECRAVESVSSYLDDLLAKQGVIKEVVSLDLKQSMKNGGGPACLRLRVALNDQEFSAVNQGVLLDDALYDTLDAWIDKHYRDQFCQTDMADSRILDEVKTALDELTSILKLPSIYSFQT